MEKILPSPTEKLIDNARFISSSFWSLANSLAEGLQKINVRKVSHIEYGNVKNYF